MSFEELLETSWCCFRSQMLEAHEQALESMRNRIKSMEEDSEHALKKLSKRSKVLAISRKRVLVVVFLKRFPMVFSTFRCF